MPIITIEGPKVEDIDRKRSFVKNVTTIVSDFFGIAEEHIIILIKENEHHNISSGGRLIIDLNKGKNPD